MHSDITYLFNVIGMKTFGHNELIELINSLVGHHKLFELNCLVGLIKFFKRSELIVKYPTSLIVRINGLDRHTRPNGIIGLVDFLGYNGLVGLIGLVGRIGLSMLVELIGIGRVRLIDLVGPIDHNGLVSSIGLGVISLVGLVGMLNWPRWPHHHMSLVGQISLVSISGLIGHNGGFISLISLGFISANWL